MSEYPEHDKMLEIGDDRQTVGDFIEWLLRTQDVAFMRWETEYEEVDCTATKSHELADLNRLLRLRHELSGAPPHVLLNHMPNCQECGGSGTIERIRDEGWREAVPPGQGGITERWLAQYYGIDLAKLSAEKDQMLAEIRRHNERESA